MRNSKKPFRESAEYMFQRCVDHAKIEKIGKIRDGEPAAIRKEIASRKAQIKEHLPKAESIVREIVRESKSIRAHILKTAQTKQVCNPRHIGSYPISLHSKQKSYGAYFDFHIESTEPVLVSLMAKNIEAIHWKKLDLYFTIPNDHEEKNPVKELAYYKQVSGLVLMMTHKYRTVEFFFKEIHTYCP